MKKKGMRGAGMAKKKAMRGGGMMTAKKKAGMRGGGMAKKSGPAKKKVMKKGGIAKKAGPMKAMRGGGYAKKRNLRDEEARVIARQDDAMDEMKRLRRKAAAMGMANGGRTPSASNPRVKTITARGMGAATKGGQFRENT